MSLPDGLEQYYDEEQQSIVILEDLEIIKSFDGAKTSPCWGQMWIGETDHYQLAVFSPSHLGDKQIVFICSAEQLGKARY